jgi:hypothetical protein
VHALDPEFRRMQPKLEEKREQGYWNGVDARRLNAAAAGRQH